MKKLLSVLLVLFLMTTVAWAEGTETANISQDDPLHAHLKTLGDTPYTISMTEYGTLEPKGFDPTTYISLLQDMQVESAGIGEAPDGEYVVLAFPEENIRFDFFLAFPEKNLFRLVEADGNEILYQAFPPEDRACISGVMTAWYSSLADDQGLIPQIEAHLPDPGWVLDSINGQVWQDDRAVLDVFLEDTDNYKVLISWGSSAWENTEWVYACEYDAGTQTLRARHVTCDNVLWDENGNETRTEVMDQDSEAVFALSGEGKLVITNAGDPRLEGKAFEATPVQENAPWMIPESNEMTPDLTAAFNQAMSELMGVNYVPLAYLGEKDGVRCFFCRATVVYPDAVPYYTLVYLNDGGVQNIWDIWMDQHTAQ